ALKQIQVERIEAAGSSTQQNLPASPKQGSFSGGHPYFGDNDLKYADLTAAVKIGDPKDVFAFVSGADDQTYIILIGRREAGNPICVGHIFRLGRSGILLLKEATGNLKKVVLGDLRCHVIDAADHTRLFRDLARDRTSAQSNPRL